ncbi:hypothetical protein VTO42DRAFT_11 [Malbranchea cinnamomea]
MPRSRPPQRSSGGVESESSTSTSPERTMNDDDTDFFMHQANDSESSVGMGNFRDLHVDTSHDPIQPPIDRLPPELLICIFSKLTSSADLMNCMRVSHKWATNCVGLLWHRPLCNTFDNLMKVASAVARPDAYFHYSGMIKRLNLSALSDKVNDGTILPFYQCKRIERLTLTNCSMLTDNGVSDLISGNSYLQALDVSELKFLTDQTIFVLTKNCSRLQGLNITGCDNITDKSLVALAENCHQLKRLKLNGVTQVTDKAIIALSNGCPSMLEIDLHGCNQITNASVKALLTTLKTLRELRLAHCTEINNQAFLSLPPNLLFDSLRILDLTACDQIRDEAVDKIIDASPRLRNLVLSKCRFITDRAVLSICKLGKNIHYVHLGHCSNITDDAVIKLVESCNRIRYIDLACCNRLTDISVQHLATLPKLKRIGLVKCQSITDRGIIALAGTRPHANPIHSPLERVHLSYCVNLTLNGIHTLLNRRPRLTHLSLTGVHAFLRDDLTQFCREAPKEFTPQQRDVFCVFSGDGVARLREYLNRTVHYSPPIVEGTMYDDADEVGDDVAGLMGATVINDTGDEGMLDAGNATPQHP